MDYTEECFLHQPAICAIKLILEFSKYLTVTVNETETAPTLVEVTFQRESEDKKLVNE